MESLPDDILHQILQIGIQAGRLDHVDLCSLAIVNSHFDQLTQDPALWATLLSRDFCISFYSLLDPSKDIYRRRLRSKREYQCPNKQLAQTNSCAGLITFWDRIDVTIGEGLGVLFFDEEWDTILPDASQPSLKQAHNRYYDSKQRKRYDKSSRPKVNPNSKSYIPMNRPPRRSMPLKI